MRFDFQCFALCEITVDDDTDLDLSEIDAKLLSFHASVLDATKEQTHRTEILRGAHKLQYSGPKWPWRAPEFPEPIYQIVPIQRLRFDDLRDVQDMIKQAAVLQQKGAVLQQKGVGV
jgi:uncharacterized protein YfkK (UPF0435 family)